MNTFLNNHIFLFRLAAAYDLFETDSLLEGGMNDGVRMIEMVAHGSNDRGAQVNKFPSPHANDKDLSLVSSTVSQVAPSITRTSGSSTTGNQQALRPCNLPQTQRSKSTIGCAIRLTNNTKKKPLVSSTMTKNSGDTSKSRQTNLVESEKYMRVPGALKPFLCTKCRKQFADMKSLKKHAQEHKELQKPKGSHRCFFCDKVFLQTAYLNQHIRKFHK